MVNCKKGTSLLQQSLCSAKVSSAKLTNAIAWQRRFQWKYEEHVEPSLRRVQPYRYQSTSEAYLKEYGEDEGSEEGEDDRDHMVPLGHGFFLYRELYDKLYSHQKAGVQWLWELHRKGKGGILGDDMGLGKTIQVISFLSGMFDSDKVKTVLVVLPVSLMSVWEKELDKWAPGIRVVAYHGTSKKERERGLAKIQRRGGVCLTTYGLVVSSWDKLGQEDGREFTWDYIILDEGHKIKNPTKTAKGVRAIGAKQRIILTGTPIQNNLQELWALFDFVHHGSLLGTSRTFKMEYDTPITRARERDATAGEKRLGMEMAESLKRIISPFFLRRTKAEVTKKESDGQNKDIKDEPNEKSVEMPTLTRKNDLIVWLFLTDAQKKIYEDFISLDDVKELLMTHKSPLVALTVLKKLCDHLRLLSTRACLQLGLTADEKFDVDDLETERGLECAANRIQFIPDDVLIKESGKLIFLVELLDNLKEDGHRCLVFSQSTKMLNIIQKIITNRGHKVMRLDGSVIHVSERQARINKFQTDQRYSVFLLTTQVGGVGLTLTAADRVVIYDPSWNPATDAQAVDRVFRIGQDKNVVIYRLITCGTVEEKIYRRQVFKDSITRQTTGNAKNPYRYFTKQELKELFSLDNPHFSTTQKQLEEMHGSHRSSDTKLDAHIAYLHSLDIFGISDHDLMFNVDPEDENTFAEGDNDYIQSRVEKAQQLLHMESNLNSDMRAQMEKYPRAVDVDPSLRTSQPTRPRPPKTQNLQPHEIIDLDSPPPKVKGEVKAAAHQSSLEPGSTMYQNLSEDDDGDTADTESSGRNSPSEGSRDIPVKEDMSEGTLIKEEIVEPTAYEGPARNSLPQGEGGDVGEDGDLGEDSFDNKENIELPVNTSGGQKDLTPLRNLAESVQNSLTSARSHLSPSSANSTPGVLNASISALSESTNALLASPATTPKIENVSINHTPKSVLSKSVNLTPKSVSRTPKSVSQGTPKSAQRTPNMAFQRLLKEEIVISPDASRPVIKTEPISPHVAEARQPPCPPRRFRHNSSDPIHCVLELPEQNEPAMEASPMRNLALYQTIVDDSPDTEELSIRRPGLGKRMSRLSVGNPRSFAVVLDSVENSPATDMESARSSPNIVTMVTESDEEVIGDSSPEDMDESSVSASTSDGPMGRAVTEQEPISSPVTVSAENSPSNSDLAGSGGVVEDTSEEEDDPEQSPQTSPPLVSKPLQPKDRQSLPQSDTKRRKSAGGRRQSGRQSGPIRGGRSAGKGKDHGKGQRHEDEVESDSDSDGEMKKKKTVKSGRRIIASSEEEEEGEEEENSKTTTTKRPAERKDKEAKKRQAESLEESEEDSEEVSGSDEDSGGSEESGEEDSFIDDEAEGSEEGSYEEGSGSEEGEDGESDYEEDSEEESEEENPIPEHQRKEYAKLESKARKLYKARRYEEALVPILQAIQIYPDPELQAAALKIHKKLNT